MPNEQNEWDHCRSYYRMYVALNETLDCREFRRLMRRFFREMRAAERLGRKFAKLVEDDARRFQALQVLLEQLDDDGQSFLDFVRELMPQAPPGFDQFGRMGNQKLPGPSPSVRTIALPDPREDESGRFPRRRPRDW